MEGLKLEDKDDTGPIFVSVSRCCVACSGESDIPRLLRERLERLHQRKDVDGCRNIEQQEDDEVDLHPCRLQVLISVNAPATFKLSLDFLPCFRSSDAECDRFNGGWIAGSSRNLLLCTTGVFDQVEYYVCDPLNKQWVAIPLAPRRHTRVHIGFIFDSCKGSEKSQQRHELSCSDCRFQVVRFPGNQMSNTRFEVETFSSDSKQWTTETVSSMREFCWSYDTLSFKSYLHNGCLHWLLALGQIVVYDPYSKKLHGTIGGPRRVETCLTHGFGGLGLCRGSFWLCQSSLILSQDLRFWKLEGYDDPTNLENCHWSLQHLFNFKEMNIGPMLASGLCHFSKSTGCNSPDYSDSCQWSEEYLRLRNSTPGLIRGTRLVIRCGIMLAIHPYDPDIVYMELSCRKHGNHFVVAFNLRTKELGQPRFGLSHGRLWDDLFTLIFPSTSTA